MSKTQWIFAVVVGLIALGYFSSSYEGDNETTTRAVEQALGDVNEAIDDSASVFSGESSGQENARESAESYLDSMAFSRKGLIRQLKYEGYSTVEATYAVDNVTVDWREEAAESAQSYLDSQSFSRDGLMRQLLYEGFTRSQASYGVGVAY